MDGLEQQLLSRVVQMERPELEEQKKKLVEEEVDSNKKILKCLEDDLLYPLSPTRPAAARCSPLREPRLYATRPYVRLVSDQHVRQACLITVCVSSL